MNSVPLGDLAGAAKATLASTISNPLEGEPQATAEGHELFIRMNCAGCHGYTGKGGMGPDLTDKSWRYGGTPAAIYNSIFEGRPQGMPSWGKALPEQEIWKLVSFVQSLGGSFPAAFAQASLRGGRQGEMVSSNAEGPGGAPASIGVVPSAPATVEPGENHAPELAPPTAPPADQTTQALQPSPSQANPVAPKPAGKDQGLGPNSNPPAAPASPATSADKPAAGQGAPAGSSP